MAAAAARTLPEASPDTARYVALLSRRFQALEATVGGAAPDMAALGLLAADRALARGVLRPLEASWHDGDENLVRGMLDRWMPKGPPAAQVIAHRLLGAAGELILVSARAETWWFFLWEMESLLALVAGEGGC